MRISGAVAIVTGGARGFGKAFTESLLKRGAKVCFADLDVRVGLEAEQELQKKYGPDSSFFIECDVTDQEQFRRVFVAAKSRFQQIHLVVNNAGILNEQNWEKTIEINLTAMMRGTYLAMEYMRMDRGVDGGLVVNIASQAALAPVFFCPAYAASKYGVLGFTRSWAMNPLVKKYGMSFATICPAFSETRMYTETISERDSTLAAFPEDRELVDAAINQLGIQGCTICFPKNMQTHNTISDQMLGRPQHRRNACFSCARALQDLARGRSGESTIPYVCYWIDGVIDRRLTNHML